MTTLHNLTGEYLALLEAVTEAADDDEAFAKALESPALRQIERQLEDKAANCALVFDQMHRDAASLREIAQQYAARARALENREKAMKKYVLERLMSAGIYQVKGRRASLTVVATSKTVLDVDDAVTLDPSSLPDDCKRVKEEIDKPAVKAKLERGEEVEGCRLRKQDPYLKVRLG